MNRSIISAATFAILLTSGCAHVNYLRDAQSAFSQAASVENQLRYGVLTDAAVESAEGTSATFSEGVLAASTGYAAVVAIVESLEADAEAVDQLKADQLYGHALVLKALALWRLERNDEAMAVSQQAVASGNLAQRDAALMRAMPGLVKNDQAFAYLERNTQFACDANEGVRCNEAFRVNVAIPLSDAICETNAARRPVAEGHAVRKYLALATLAAVRNAAAACEKTDLGALSLADCRTHIVQACIGTHTQPATLYKSLLGELCDEYRRGVTTVQSLVQSLGLGEATIEQVCPSRPGLGDVS